MSVSVLAAVAALLIALMLFLKVGAPALSRRLIFKPERGKHDFKKPEFPDSVSHEHIFVTTPDGERLHGWLVGREHNQGLVLICHGNRGSIAGREDTALFYLELGLDVCLFDYRGYGRSTGSPSEQGTYTDVDAVWHYLTTERGYNPGDVALLGRSLGAAIAAHLASHAVPRAVILESTFSTLHDLATELYPLLKSLFNVHIKYNTLEKIPRIRAPLLLVHSSNDELIGIHHGHALQTAAPTGTELIEISGRHRDGFVTSKSTYLPAVERFLEQHPPTTLIRRLEDRG